MERDIYGILKENKMATNARPEFFKAQAKYNEAKTNSEKIRALEEMLSLAPDHKSAENLRAEIKTKIAKLKDKIEKETTKKSKGYSFAIKKEGAATVCVVGVVNSGKSTLLSKLTNVKEEISSVLYSTKMPKVGIANFNGILLQIVEIPAIVQGFYKREKGPLFSGIIRNSDMVVIVVRQNPKTELEFILHELDLSNIRLNEKKETSEVIAYLKGVIVLNNNLVFLHPRFSVVSVSDSDLLEKIWGFLGLIYVYTKTPGRKKDYPPVAMKKGSTVKNLAEHVHKDFVRKFKFARVWGKSSKFESGQVVGLTHVLAQEDVVELHIK